MHKPYEGSEPYIFISYAHADREDVFAVLSELYARGYRIWFDEGITPGSEWPENIAQHLSAASLVIAFITPRSIASANCRREITFALSRDIPFLSVFLEKTEVPLGIELQLSAQQSVLRYNYTNQADFIERLCSCPDLAPCRDPILAASPSAENEDVIGNMPADSAAATQGETSGNTPGGQAGVPGNTIGKQGGVSGSSAGKQGGTSGSNGKPGGKGGAYTLDSSSEGSAVRKAPKPARRVKAEEGAAKPKKKLLLPILGAILILAAAIIIPSVIRQAPVKLTDTVSVKRDISTVKLTDTEITASIVNKLNKLPKLSTLELEGCSFAEGALSALSLEKLTIMRFTGCTGLTDTAFISRQPRLAALYLRDCSLTDDALTDVGQTINTLDVSDNPALSRLPDLPDLSTLRLDGTAISDLSPAASCASLSEISANDAPVTDISCLGELTGLTSLSFDRCGISVLPDRFASLRIRSLSLAGAQFEDPGALTDQTTLETVDLSDAALTDISWLAKSAETLTSLDLSRMSVTPKDLSVLSSLGSLTAVSLDEIPLISLDFFARARSLKWLSAEACGLTDISALQHCPKLVRASLCLNAITDVSALAGLEGNELTIDLACNQITDISPLPLSQIRFLLVFGNPLSITPDLFNIKEKHLIAIDYSEDLLKTALSRSRQRSGNLPVPYYTVLLFGCPRDRMVDFEDDIYGVKFYDTDTLQDYAQFLLQDSNNVNGGPIDHTGRLEKMAAAMAG